MRIALSSLLLVTLATASSALRHPLEHYEEKFRAWIKAYKVHIAEGHDWHHRLHIFADNDDYIHSHNTHQQNVSYSLGHNEYSHLTLDEFHAHFKLGKYARESGKTLAYAAHVAEKKTKNVKRQAYIRTHTLDQTLTHTHTHTATPTEVDWVKKGAVTAIKNQGMCGSCWAFSTTGAVEGAYAIKNNKLLSFSEQELVDCDNVDYGCNGGLMDNAFGWIEKNGGLATEETYPYAGTEGRCKKSVVDVVEGTTVTDYTDVPVDDDESFINAIAKQPVSVAIEADERSFQLYASGVFTGTCGTNLDHGVLAVGFGEEDGNGYYKVKNSWGETWGEDGYIRLVRGKRQEGGQCGILLAASYPTL